MKLYFDKYYVTVGLEIHVALKTEKKLFSQSKADFSIDRFSLFDCATPGVLPILNYEPVYKACAFGYATKADVKQVSVFERKHYFYPDLSPGYQITQQYDPIIVGGVVPIYIDGIEKTVFIEHAHLECDAAKSIHDDYLGVTKIDISRGSSSLLEIVSTPCMHSPQEAKEYAKAVHSLVTFLDICDGKMQEGSFRVDASISLSKEKEKLGTRVEIKNISSFAYIEEALDYEIQRQADLLDKKLSIAMETRLYSEDKKETFSMRDKETVGEYRYMPDPDIPKVVLSSEELQKVKKDYYQDYFCLYKYFKDLIDSKKLLISYSLLQTCLSTNELKEHFIEMYKQKIDDDKVLKTVFFMLFDIYSKQVISKKISFKDLKISIDWDLGAKELKDALLKYLTSSNNELKISDFKPIFEDESIIDEKIKEILSLYKLEIEKYKSGEEKILQFLVGKCMSQLKGKIPADKLKNKIISFIN